MWKNNTAVRVRDIPPDPVLRYKGRGCLLPVEISQITIALAPCMMSLAPLVEVRTLHLNLFNLFGMLLMHLAYPYPYGRIP